MNICDFLAHVKIKRFLKNIKKSEREDSYDWNIMVADLCRVDTR